MAFDSLILADGIELCGGGVPSANPACPGATYYLGEGFDFGIYQPTSDQIASLILDGEQTSGHRVSNRLITLPVVIKAPSRLILDAAREELLQAISAPRWTMRWTRDPAGGTPLPLLFDCQTANASIISYSIKDDKQLVSQLVIAFPAAPYGKSDVPVVVEFTSPLAGKTAPATPVTVDAFASVSGAQWAQSLIGPGPHSAHWDPSIAPAGNPAGAGLAATYAQAGIGPFNLTGGVKGSVGAYLNYADMGQPDVPSAIAAWQAITGRPLTARRAYYGLSATPGAITTDLLADAAAGRRVCITLRPAYNPVSASDLAALGTFLASCKTAGLQADITLWHEPYYAGLTSAQYIAMVNYYGPAVRLYYPLVFVTAATSVALNSENSYYPGDLACDKIATDLYASDYTTGTRLDTAASLADGAVPPKPFGLWEFNASTALLNGLTGQNTGFEGGAGAWGATGGNSSVAGTSAQAHGGTSSLAVTSVAAGTMQAASSSIAGILTAGIPCAAGDSFDVSGWFRAAVSARTCNIGLAFYDSTGTAIGATIFGANITDSASAWTQAFSNGVIAPANAARCRVVAQVVATGGAAEVHYVDDVTAVSAHLAAGAAYFGYVQSYFSARLTARKANADILLFNAATVPVQESVITSGADYRVALLNNAFAVLDASGGQPPGLTALTLFCGFGSTNYYPWWCKAGGAVRFAFTLTDGTRTVSFAKTYKRIKGSNSAANPLFTKIRVPVPQNSLVNLAAVTGYTLTVTNRAGSELAWTDLYLDSLTAVPPVVVLPSPQRGVVYDMAGVIGTARAPVSLQFQQAGAPVLTTQSWTSTGGPFQFAAPQTVTNLASVICTGPGGAGSLMPAGGTSGGGGSGETASEVNVAVTPLKIYSGMIGNQGTYSPVATGTSTTFAGDSVTVTAHPGGTVGSGSFTGGVKGTGSANTTHHDGAAGGTGGSGLDAGGGGASSGGTAAAGSPGATGASGGAAGAAVTGGGPGGHGAVLSANTTGKGGASAKPGGGGGGGAHNPSVQNLTPGNGGWGQVIISYLAPAAFKTLLAHRPASDAPDTLCPFVSPDSTDVPDGTTEYPVPSLIAGLNARFNGTYTVVLVNNTWHAPTLGRNLTVTVREYEQPGGAVYSYPTVPLTVTPVNLPGPMVTLGELTLPGKRLPHDNLNAYFTVTITSSDTADTFLDVLFLDTRGSTVAIQSATSYGNYYIDEAAGSDFGLIMGSAFDRTDAISVTDQAMAISGTGLTADPEGNQSLLVYAAEGAPNAEMTYTPRWRVSRTA